MSRWSCWYKWIQCYRNKLHFSRNCSTYLWISDSSSVHCFWDFVIRLKTEQDLKFFWFPPQSLAMVPRSNIFHFLPSFWFGILRTENTLVSDALQTKARWRDTNSREITTTTHSNPCVCCYLGHPEPVTSWETFRTAKGASSPTARNLPDSAMAIKACSRYEPSFCCRSTSSCIPDCLDLEA